MVEVEDLSRQASGQVTTEEAASSPEDPTGSDRHTKLLGAVQGHMKRLGFAIDEEDREERLRVLSKLLGVSYSTDTLVSTGDFETDELKALADTLAKCSDAAALRKALLDAGETGA